MDSKQSQRKRLIAQIRDGQLSPQHEEELQRRATQLGYSDVYCNLNGFINCMMETETLRNNCSWQDVDHTKFVNVDEDEVYEWYSVSQMLARRFEDIGERVIEAFGHRIWCRTSFGQSISMDFCMRHVAAEIMADTALMISEKSANG